MKINFTSVLIPDCHLPATNVFKHPYTNTSTAKYVLPGPAAMAHCYIDKDLTQNQ
jgi:hypothetical protein